MRIVADTNCVVSGLLWDGPPRRILERARDGHLTLHTSPALLTELARVLTYPKLNRVLQSHHLEAEFLVQRYALAALIWHAPSIPSLIAADPTDDDVLACALACQAQAIVSGDRHLLSLKSFHEIPVLTPSELMVRLES